MPTLVILATTDTALADVWERQLPSGQIALRLQSEGFPARAAPGFAAVVVLDAVCEASLPPAFVRCPTIYVGEPRSIPYEQARMTGRGKVYLSYEDSATGLRGLLPLVGELAEKQALVELLSEKNSRADPPRVAAQTTEAESSEWWDFLEGAVESIASPEGLMAEFRRASRRLLRASHVLFFRRENDGFRADRGASFIPADDPLVTYFENHPVIIDGTNWDGPAEPVAELTVRNQLVLWGARLLVPVHDNGRLLGLIALGIRDDGQPYDAGDQRRAIFFARLLRHFLAKTELIRRLSLQAEQANLGAKYLPGTIVLGPNENAPRHVPLVVRELVGQSRRTRETSRVSPAAGQPFRARAGIIAETGGTWAFWEEASSEVHDNAARDYSERRALLREIALTLSHEVGNALVSLATFRQLKADNPAPAALLETVKADVAKLETLNNQFALMEALYDTDAAVLDVRDLVQTIGNALGLRVEVGPDPVELSVSRKLIDFALRSLLRTIAENRPEQGMRELTLKVRSTGAGPEQTALLSVKGRDLHLEGILPEPVDDSVPNQGRMSVFLAKEILRLHHGEIHAGPGMEGTEILISIRQW